MSKINTISVLGCGWLGLPLAEILVAEGFAVKGSTTTEKKMDRIETAGAQPFLLKLEPELTGERAVNFFNADLLFINVPPSLRLNSEDYYLQQLRAVMEAVAVSPIKQLIFISTTSVYAELNREVVEADADPGHPLFRAEQFVSQQAADKQLTVLRCGGLMGYDRIPAKYFAGKKGLTTGDIQVNYVHRDDVIGIVKAIIDNQIWGETLNVVAPEHPARKDVYEKACREHNYELSEFVTPTTPHDFKVVSPQRLVDLTKYIFKYANPLDFYYER